MKPAKLDLLIEKYYAGETSPEEEKELKAYILGREIQGAYLELKEQFEIMDLMSKEQLSDDFDTKLLENISGSKKNSKTFIGSFWISGIAATILLFIAIWFGSDLLQPKAVYGTITDPELAFNETKKVLDEVSKKMNKGITPAKKTVDKVEGSVKQAGEIKKINNALNKAKSIDKLEEASDLLKSMNKVYIRIGNS